jgi:NAD(P)-dependent dehydrogenase (short-subunit alcohol dehydrogenase family)
VVILVTNRIVLVTGATRGIGKAVIEGVAAAGQTAILAGRDEARAAAAAKETGGEACPVVIDVTDQSTITAAAAFIRQRYGRLDSLVNNAGVNIGYERPPSQTLLTDMRAVGEFNRSSQHLDHGGSRWDAVGSSCRSRRQVHVGSGQRIGRCVHRCVHLAGLSPHVGCNGSSGG